MTTPPPSANDLADRSLALALAFLAEQIDHPERLAEIPSDTSEPVIVLLPDDDPELAAYNFQLGLQVVQEGRNVYFRHVSGRVTAGAI